MSAQLGPGHFGFSHAYFDRVYGAAGHCSEALCDLSAGSLISLDGSADAGPFELRVTAGPVIRGRMAH